MMEKPKDWVGNSRSTFATLGASNHSPLEREENDYYATDPNSLKLFLNRIKGDFKLHDAIWECACGGGHLSKELIKNGYLVYSTDLIDRGYGFVKDFLTAENVKGFDILTNPPYKYAQEFVEHAMDILDDGYYCIMYLRLQFLEGQKRKKLFSKHPLKYVYVNSTRQTCYMNGDMSQKCISAVCFCWFVWQKGYKGEPIIRWI